MNVRGKKRWGRAGVKGGDGGAERRVGDNAPYLIVISPVRRILFEAGPMRKV